MATALEQHRIFDVIEMVENILVNLDLVTMTTSQRVSKTWKAVIARVLSRTDMRQFRFLDPAPAIWAVENDEDDMHRFMDVNLLHDHGGAVVTLHPGLVKYLVSEGEHATTDIEPSSIYGIEFTLTPAKFCEWAAHEGLRDVLVTQAPCDDVFLVDKLDFDMAELQFKPHVTMDQLSVAVKEFSLNDPHKRTKRKQALDSVEVHLPRVVLDSDVERMDIREQALHSPGEDTEDFD